MRCSYLVYVARTRSASAAPWSRATLDQTNASRSGARRFIPRSYHRPGSGRRRPSGGGGAGVVAHAVELLEVDEHAVHPLVEGELDPHVAVGVEVDRPRRPFIVDGGAGLDVLVRLAEPLGSGADHLPVGNVDLHEGVAHLGAGDVSRAGYPLARLEDGQRRDGRGVVDRGVQDGGPIAAGGPQVGRETLARRRVLVERLAHPLLPVDGGAQELGGLGGAEGVS